MTNELKFSNSDEFIKIKNFEDYSINREGLIKSNKTNNIRKLVKTKSGYTVDLNNANFRGKFRIDLLVAETFIPNPNGYLHVRHIDGDVFNNHIENLEWYDPYEELGVYPVHVNDEYINKTYRVTRDGRVYSISSKQFMKLTKGKRRRIEGNYRNTYFRYYVDTLVASAFIPNPNGYSFVRHLDNDVSNDNVENLEWYDPFVYYGFRKININDDYLNENYMVNDKGEIWSLFNESFMTLTERNNKITLRKVINNVHKEYDIDYIVACTFIPNPNKYSSIRHIDGNTLNNHVENLEWYDPFEHELKGFVQLKGNDKYLIHPDGKLYSLSKGVIMQHERIDKYGYRIVSIKENYNDIDCRLCDLVARTFMPEYKKGDIITHIIKDSFNDSIENLKISEHILDGEVYEVYDIYYNATFRYTIYDILDNNKFKPIQNFENYYRINEYGHIFSLYYNLFLSQYFNKKYYTVTLSNNNISINKSVHVLVAEAFITKPNDYDYFEINHIDGNTLNNHVSNLEWTTHIKNVKHAVETGLYHTGYDKCNAVNIKAINKLTGQIIHFPSKMETSAKLNISIFKIDRLLEGRIYNDIEWTLEQEIYLRSPFNKIK